jgi:epoxide hydrolase-like predicted phosphatase
MIKAIIFDFFGVLVGEGFDATYRYAGGNPAKDKDFIEELLDKANRGRITVDEFRAKICKQLGISVEEYQAAIEESERPNTELLAYIKTLQPKYKTAILSNVNRGGLERRIKREILDQHFDELVVSGDIGFIKPEPEIYELTAKKLGVKLDECIFIDDRTGYVHAAKELGMQGILYKDFPQMKKELEELLAAVTDK